MLDFQPITLDDKERMDEILKMNTYRSSDLVFTNLFAWAPMYSTRACIRQRTLFIRYDDSPTCISYMMPIGMLPLHESLDLIMQDADRSGAPFQIMAVTPRMWNDIMAAMPEKFTITPDRDNYEYIYSSEKLISLAGSKLQSKRNHINRFKAENPDWAYSAIATDEDIRDCMEVLDQWENLAVGEASAVRKECLGSYAFDYAASVVMLENYRRLKLRGGIIRVDGRAVAFSLGEPLSDDMIVVHVEKARAEIHGSYAIMNQQFAEHEAAGYKYINREEDVGLENLRKAKMSYHPVLLLKHGTVKSVD